MDLKTAINAISPHMTKIQAGLDVEPDAVTDEEDRLMHFLRAQPAETVLAVLNDPRVMPGNNGFYHYLLDILGELPNPETSEGQKAFRSHSKTALLGLGADSTRGDIYRAIDLLSRGPHAMASEEKWDLLALSQLRVLAREEPDTVSVHGDVESEPRCDEESS